MYIKKSWVFYFILVFLLVTAYIGVRYTSLKHKLKLAHFFQPTYVNYEEFGISIPEKYQIHGVDVSRYQGLINWQMVKDMDVKGKNVKFAFVKATEGLKLVDREFHNNWINAKKADIICGAYHYFRPSKDAKQQARHFINQVRLRKGDLPPVLDIEEIEGKTAKEIQDGILAWLQYVEKFYKIKPILYTYQDFYNRYIASHPKLNKYPLWIAYYDEEHPSLKGNRKWHFWQHSDKARVSGIVERVDFNTFSGDLTTLKKMCL